MKESGEQNGNGFESPTDVWAREVLAQIEEEYDGLLGRQSGWSDRIIVKNLGPLRDWVERSIGDVVSHNNGTSDEAKKAAIKDILASYEKKKDALLTQLM
jgi:hypothetical protein